MRWLNRIACSFNNSPYCTPTFGTNVSCTAFGKSYVWNARFPALY